MTGSNAPATVRLLLALALLLALMPAAPALAQPANGAIHGTVQTADGEALPGALLFLTGADLPEMRNAVSNEEGVFEFFYLEPGTYRLEAIMTGFVTDISEVSLTFDGTIEVTVTLERAPALSN